MEEAEPLRLIIQSLGEWTASKSAETLFVNCQGEIHQGVTCNGCDGIIQGFRYKCLQCPEYSHCGFCEIAGVHAGHPFIRTTGPVVILKYIFNLLTTDDYIIFT